MKHYIQVILSYYSANKVERYRRIKQNKNIKANNKKCFNPQNWVKDKLRAKLNLTIYMHILLPGCRFISTIFFDFALF